MIDGLVSIVMPLYNAESTAQESIQSVISQTYHQWELLVVDDGSVDRGPQLVERLSEQEHRIHLLSMPENSGAAAARNYGIRQATGQYLAFLDSDDLWDADKLERQLYLMEEKHTPFSYGACRVIHKDGSDTGKWRQVSAQLDFAHALYGNQMPCLTVMLDRKALRQQYPELELQFPYIGHEDYALWLSILQLGVTAYGITEPLGAYRVASGSLSGNKRHAAAWTYRIYRDYLHFGLARSIVCFVGYAISAVLKRI